MNARLAMVVDASRCMDCKACLVACRTAHEVPAGMARNWVRQSDPDGCLPRAVFGFQPGACMHCAEPTCTTACPTGATSKDPQSGVILINRALCVGCGACVAACPYGARYLYGGKCDKCDTCAARRVKGLQPACVDCCPSDVRVFGDLNDPASEASKRLGAARSVALVAHADTPTKPQMFYINGTFDTGWPQAATLPASLEVMRGFSTLFQIGGGLLLLALTATGLREYLAPDPQHPQENHDA